jgi:amino acid transporter
LLATVALFGVDYFTSFFYATGEMMHALHPYGLQNWGYLVAGAIALGNITFGGLYMYSLGIFNEGGGSYTASMRYLWPGLSLVVAVVLIQDYTLTIVVSALSGGDQLLSILNLYGKYWWLHFALGAALAAVTWFLTIRGRGESARVVFTLLGVFVILTLLMAGGLFIAHVKGVAPAPYHEEVISTSVWQALYHMLTATMKGMVALTGLEAMSNGIQFVKNEDVALVRWGKRRLPRLNGLWNFYTGKSGIGRFVQTLPLSLFALTFLMVPLAGHWWATWPGSGLASCRVDRSFFGFTRCWQSPYWQPLL